MIVHALEFWILFLHLREDLALDTHESGRAIQNLYESILDWTIRKLEIHHEARTHLVRIFSLSGLYATLDLVPHDALLRVAGHSDIMTRLNKPNNRFWIKVNISINEEEVGRLRFLHEASDG